MRPQDIPQAWCRLSDLTCRGDRVSTWFEKQGHRSAASVDKSDDPDPREKATYLHGIITDASTPPTTVHSCDGELLVELGMSSGRLTSHQRPLPYFEVPDRHRLDEAMHVLSRMLDDDNQIQIDAEDIKPSGSHGVLLFETGDLFAASERLAGRVAARLRGRAPVALALHVSFPGGVAAFCHATKTDPFEALVAMVDEDGPIVLGAGPCPPHDLTPAIHLAAW